MKRILVPAWLTILLLTLPPVACFADDLDDNTDSPGWQVQAPIDPSPLEQGTIVQPLGGLISGGSSSGSSGAYALAPTDLQPGAALQTLMLGQPTATNTLISETARALDYNWAQCYLFVRNQIRFTPYRGVSRGPERTLLDREGSDGDQAFLLLALLQACGYTNNATVLYAEPPTGYYTGGFVMPLGGTSSGYDAAAWLGIAATGTVSSVWSAASFCLNNARVSPNYCVDYSGGLPAAVVRVPHFWVRLTLNGTSYNLDPSFKPRTITPFSASLMADMGYVRTNFLTLAGGTTNSLYVQGLSGSAIASELCRLSTNLIAKWQATGTNAAASFFIGGDTIVPQDLSIDSATFHGTTNGAVIVDFLAQSDTYKNALRTSLTFKHGGLNNTFWLDELGARHLWFCYTNATAASTTAVLRLDDAIVTNEPTGYAQSTATIIVSNSFSIYSQSYSLVRSNGSVYAIAMGFGGDHVGGMRSRAENELGRLRAAGLAESDPGLRSRVLEVVGQQWLAQTALMNVLDSRLKNSGQHFFYNIGIAGQASAPYVDLKNSFSYNTVSVDASKFDGYMLFSSALEHGVLDQVNGTNRPAVSTVRMIDQANATNLPIYFASSANWSSIRSALTNYGSSTLSGFDTDIGNGRKILLPKDASITFRRWKGCGYIDYGPNGGGYSTAMIISGGLNGGNMSESGWTISADGQLEYAPTVMGDFTTETPHSEDPVDMQAGASLISRTDLSMSGPMPLVWTRQYDARARWTDGYLGRGWTHSYDIQANVHANPDAFFGRAAPAACVPAVVASAVVSDLLAAGENAKDMATACLVAKWWTDQLVDGAVIVKTDNESLSFSRSPDGSYAPAPGVTATLAQGANGSFTLQERLGRTWTFATNGVLTSIVDPSGNSTALSYTNANCLVAVSNSFGRKFTITWAGNRFGSISDSAGRSVSYRYSPSGCLTGVTDAAGYAWSLSYDPSNTFVSETDPSGVLTVSNSVNSLGQVVGQLSANGAMWSFGFAAGVSAWERDPFSNRISYVYNDDGRLVQRVNRDSTTNLFFYDGQGQMVSNVDAIGRTTVSQYDANNHLVSLTEAANTPNARSTVFSYDSQHHLVALSNALGRVTRLGYDASHRLTSRLAPDGTTVTNVYDSHGLPTSTAVKDASGRTLTSTTLGYDSRGFATTISPLDGGTQQFGYDNAGNVTNVTDALGHATRFAYDARGMVSNAVDALNGRKVRTYTSAGRLAAAADPLAHTNTFYWTAAGHPAGVRLPNSGIATNTYDVANRLVSAQDPRGNRVAFDLDVLGRVTRSDTPNWQEQVWYDTTGCVTTRLDAVNGRTDIGYDWLNRPAVVVDPMDRAWTNSFDALDGLTGVIDPKRRTTSYGLDVMERRTRVVYSSGRTEGFSLDALGRLTAFTNSEGHVYRLAYDGQSRVIAATNGAGEQVFHNFFDVGGNLTNRLDGAGRPTRRQFDVLNRCTNTVYSDGSSEAFTFDAAGNLLTARNAATTNAFGYDSMNRLAVSTSRVAGVAFTTAYQRDLGGNTTNLTYPGGNAVRYFFDADGRVTNVTDWAGHIWSFTRDAAGRMTGTTYPNGITGAWSYDASHAVSSWAYSGATNLPGRTITRDKMGLKTKEDVTGPMPQVFANRRAVNTFNNADRLVSAQVTLGTNVFAETYTYDGCGALTNVTRGTGTNDLFSYDLAGRLVSALTTNSLQSTAYSLFTGSYDALGNRVRTAVNGTNRLWAVDHSDSLKRPLVEATTNGVVVRTYIWGAGRLLGIIESNGTLRCAHVDDMGSVVALTDASGTVVFTANYGPYGEPWGSTGTNTTPFGWMGGHGVYHVDGGSLYLTRHRAYDTTLKRFLSSDPQGLGGGANLYAYALGNPLAYIDPFGLGAESSLWDDVKNWVSNTASDIANDPMWDALAYTPVGPEYKAAEAVAAGVVAGVVEGSADALKAARYLEGLLASEAAQTVFKTTHYAPRLEAVGVNVTRVESIVAQEIAAVRPNMTVGSDIAGRLTIDGVLVEYRARLLANGTVNVGTIFPVK